MHFVAIGLAVFVVMDDVIRFIERNAAIDDAKRTGLGYDRLNRMLDRKECRRLPMINPDKMIREEKSSRN